MQSNYLLGQSATSSCPYCHQPPKLLSNTRQKPWFYICFTCKRVWEVGKGQVHEQLDFDLDQIKPANVHEPKPEPNPAPAGGTTGT